MLKFINIKPFQANVAFLNSLKTSENQLSSDDFRRYRMGTLVGSGMNKKPSNFFCEFLTFVSDLAVGHLK